MAYRRSKEALQAACNWSTFVARNSKTIEAAGLPEVVTESIEHWDDFLMHGYLDHHPDPTEFDVNQLSTGQYTALVQLVDSYFVSGYEYFTPMTLREEDLLRLQMRYGNR